MIDIPESFYYSCDVRPDTLMPETVASHFGWCSSLVICVSLPANHLAERSIINLSVNHFSRNQRCRMSVGGSEADMCWPHVQLWHIPLCSLASWWVVCVGEAFVIPATQVWALWRRREHARKRGGWLGDISTGQGLRRTVCHPERKQDLFVWNVNELIKADGGKWHSCSDHTVRAAS